MKNLTIGIIALALVAASVGAYYNLRNGEDGPEVREARVTRGDLVESVGATGTLEAVNTVQVGTQVSGTIKELHADFNSIVRRGQVVARLDPSLFQTQIDQANANLVRAQADVERLRVALQDAQTKLGRARELSAKQLIPQSELDTADVNVRAAEAQLRSAQAQVTQARATLNQNQVNLRHTVITAPIDGIVISRNVDVGQTVAASMQAPILFLLAADLTKMKVNASIDEADVGRIRPGQLVRFRVDAYPAEEFVGSVQQVRLQPVVVQNVVTYATVIDVPNRDLKLKPGMTANVTIEIARRNDVMRVPNAALRFRPTPDTFEAIGQSVPPETHPGFDDAGRAGRTRGPDTQAPSNDLRNDAQLEASGRTSRDGKPGRAAAVQRQGDGSGRGEGRRARGGATQDPERRREFLQRLESMPAEQRERIMQRMRERGSRFDATGQGSQDSAAAGEPGEKPGGAPAGTRAPARQAEGGGTIDSLFGPLPASESSGRVWVYTAGQLKMVRVRLGITDGAHTELLSGNLSEGTALVTSVITGEEATSGAGGGRSPLMGPDRRQGRPGVRNAPQSGGGGR